MVKKTANRFHTITLIAVTCSMVAFSVLSITSRDISPTHPLLITLFILALVNLITHFISSRIVYKIQEREEGE